MTHLSFTSHPASVGETYFEHLRHASTLGARMLKAGVAFSVNGFFPCLCRRTGPTITASLGNGLVDSQQKREIQGRLATTTCDIESSQHTPAAQMLAKAVAWWIEYENGRHSSPYPSEAEARNAAFSPSSGRPKWMMSSEGDRIAMRAPSPELRLRPIEGGLAIFLCLLVASAAYWGESTRPLSVTAGLLPRSTPVTPRSKSMAKSAALLSSVRVQMDRRGDRNTELNVLIGRVLDTQNQESRVRPLKNFEATSKWSRSQG